MEEFAAGILQQARKSAKVQTEFSMWENIQGFYHAVGQSVVCVLSHNSVVPGLTHWFAHDKRSDWSEPWIIGLILFHICMYALVIRFRKSSNFQMASFVFICAIVFCAEPMNTWLQRRWRLFATQNYFDRSGVFMSVMFSCPLLLLVFAQLVRVRSVHRLCGCLVCVCVCVCVCL